MRIEDIKSSFNIEDVIGKDIPLKRQGSQYVGNCPFHDDHHASLKISPTKQNFKCFVSGCGASGDMFDYFMKKYSVTYREAADIITNGTTALYSGGHTHTPAPREPEITWTSVTPPQNDLPDPARLWHGKYGNPSMTWAYHNTSGETIGYICRFDLPEGKKDVIPYTYKNNGTESKWTWRGFDTPRPLYNLHELTVRHDAIVLLVEGEKTADAARRLYPQFVVTTWPGGSEAVKNIDWSPLHGRRVYLWNDNDLAGVLCMFGGWSLNDKTGEYRRVMGICEIVPATFKRIQNSPDFPRKWDLADAHDWTSEYAAEYLRDNRVDIPAVSEFPPNELPINTPVAPPPPPAPVIPSQPELTEPEPETKNPYFRCLGFRNNDNGCLYVFFVYRTNTIVKLSPGGITVSNLLQLAPLNYWEKTYPKSTARSGAVKFEINTIADHLITMSTRIGFFSPSKIRGRGAWLDNGLPVIHCGDKLIVNGVDTQFNKHQSRFIYEAGEELGFELTAPLTATEANQLIVLLQRLSWGRDINAKILAGWIVIAILCGALPWRPHLWLTGASSTGKSWVFKNIIKKLLGQMVLNAQSTTTEAGIRQFLKADAIPVVIDEIESENKKGDDRVQAVLELMRASSTSDGGKIIKGSSGGDAALYEIKSCFAFASIGVNITQRSDASRISVLELKKDDRQDKETIWQETKYIHYKLITHDYIQAFQSRAVMMMPTILKNAETFSSAAAAELDNQRSGDQIGVILAGAYSLYSDGLISYEDAKKWVKQQDWSEERMSDATKDEVKVLHKIIDSETRVETAAGDNRFRTIGELITAANGDTRDPFEAGLITKERAKETLKRLGILVENGHTLFSDSSIYIKRILNNTSWAINYPQMLSRINGAVKIDNVTFGSGVKSRATRIDTIEIFGNYDVEQPVNPVHQMPPVAQSEINFKK